jgi:hypothetical protein
MGGRGLWGRKGCQAPKNIGKKIKEYFVGLI